MSDCEGPEAVRDQGFSDCTAERNRESDRARMRLKGGRGGGGGSKSMSRSGYGRLGKRLKDKVWRLQGGWEAVGG